MPYQMLVVESEYANACCELWNDSSLVRWGISADEARLLEAGETVSMLDLSFRLETQA